MSQMEESQPEDIALETPIPGSFVPPSIDHTVLLSGESYEHYSPVPPSLLPAPPTPSEDTDLAASRPLGPPCALGIDEAGRGPVLGPMVYGAFYLPIQLSDPLLRTAHHFDDSKVLTPAFRSELMERLCTASDSTSTTPDPQSLHDNCGWAVSLLSARTISAGMLQQTSMYNLNAQAMDATISLIQKIYALGVNIKEIYIDTIGQPAIYQKKLEKIFPTASIVVAKKADSLYPCVSAASVCAKVTRDVALEVIYEQNYSTEAMSGIENPTNETVSEEDPGWGSGYPSDVRCTSWMKRHMDPVFGWGNETRFSWGTAKDMLDLKGAAVNVVWPVDGDEESRQMTDFFSAEGEAVRGSELAGWFGSRVSEEVF